MTEPQQGRPVVRTRFVRGNFSRVIHADGAWGAVTPQWNIHMALYSERPGTPDETEIQLDVQGGVRDVAVTVPTFLIREIEADVILSEASAVGLRNWLNERLSELQSVRQASQS